MVLHSKTHVQRVARQAVEVLVKNLGDGCGGGFASFSDLQVRQSVVCCGCDA